MMDSEPRNLRSVQSGSTVPKYDSKRRAFHRNNNDSSSNSLRFENSEKRMKMHDSKDNVEKETDIFDEDELFPDDVINPTNNNGTEDSADSDESSSSDKFYSQIINRKPASKPLLSTSIQSDLNKSSSRTRSDTSDGSNSLEDSRVHQPVHVLLKIINPLKGEVILDTTVKSDMGKMNTFLKNHGVDISGYSGDISPEGTAGSIASSTRASSLGSTIPRPSDASTLNRPSVATDVPKMELNEPVKRKRGRPMKAEPLPTSTRISESNVSSGIASEPKTPVSESVNTKDDSTVTSTPLTSADTTLSPTEESKGQGDVSEKGMPRRSKGLSRNGIASIKSIETFQNPDFAKSATLWGTIANDEVVFARWRDRSYYSGRIVKKGMNDTWSIHFEDDMEDVASETHILPIKIIGVGTWTVYCPPDKYEPENTIIVGQRFLNSTHDLERTEYAIVSDIDGRVIFCRRKSLTLLEADAKEMRKQYQVQITPRPANLSLDNILSGRRRRGGATSPTPSSLIRKLVAEIDSGTRSGPGSESERSSTPVNDTPTTSKKVISKNSGKVATTKFTSTTTETTAKPLPSVSLETPSPDRVVRKLSIDTETNSGGGDLTMNYTKEFQKFLNPYVPGEETPRGGKVFEGLEFFLTATGGTPPQDTSILPYDKDRYRELIEMNAGIVVDTVGCETLDRKHVYLVSDSYARTVKYIYALAAGIPCVSHTWVTKCLRQDEIVDCGEFELNSGISIESNTITPPHREKPLRGMKVYVTGVSDELYKYWKPVLTAAEATLLKRHSPKSKGQPTSPAIVPDQIDVLIVDTNCPEGILEDAKSKGIPIVKPEWLVQTIITGKRVPYDGHQRYCVELTEVEGTP